MNIFSKYTHWLHTQWPAGQVEKAPEVGELGSTAMKGVRVVGDLTGIPLLKFSSDSGARAVQAIKEEADFKAGDGGDGVPDIAIIGAGVSGMAAAMEAKRLGLSYVLLEADEAFSTIHNFPRRKPIYTYPTEMTPAGDLRFTTENREDLLDELREQQEQSGVEITRNRIENLSRDGNLIKLHSAKGEDLQAQRVLVAIGRTGNFRKLNVPGESLDKVSNRLLDAKEFGGKKVIVVGGGDSALEAAIALSEAGANVILSYRKKEFSRPKPDNIDGVQKLVDEGKLDLKLGTQLQEIHEDHVMMCEGGDEDCRIENDAVFTLIGREPPLDFFRKSGIPIVGEFTPKVWALLAGFLALMFFFYHWKAYKPVFGIPGTNLWQEFASKGWFPFNLSVPGTEGQFWHSTMSTASSDPGFHFALLYTVLIVVFGIKRIRRRKTPYVTVQTLTLMSFQVIPLFLLPYVIFPWMGANGAFSSGGFGEWFGMTFLSNGPGTEPTAYWRAFGFILAWPLFIYNVFTPAPMWGWLILSFIQTFVIIPFIIWKWGKGAYCGWICSCGAMAETLGDQHRQKMPHGPKWNKLNMLGQGILAFAFLLLLLRIASWIPGSPLKDFAKGISDGWNVFSYKYIIDIWLAGIIGYGLYFQYSGRVWCRFACPLAALMHIYARFSRFRIFADKKKCISCNVCTSVCHQGIDIMNFANKGRPMEDPECVRCSACVQSCPTGVLQFGMLDGKGGINIDKLPASPVLMQEMKPKK